MDIIQNFRFDPDQKSSIQMVDGDSGIPIGNTGGDFAGPTYRDIFLQRLRVGTFGRRDMPNHGFLAILTENQLGTAVGKKWLAILKENGFEFIRAVSNSVYAGQSLLGSAAPSNHSRNYLFGLFRNIGSGAVVDPFTPPKAWTDLPKVKDEAWDNHTYEQDDRSLAERQRAQDTEIWNRIGPAKFLSREEVLAAGAPVIFAGIRSENMQEEESIRSSRMKGKGPAAAPSDPFNQSPAAMQTHLSQG